MTRKLVQLNCKRQLVVTSATLLVTSALLVVTRTLLVTSALLVVTRTLLVTSALLVVTRTLLVTSALLVVTRTLLVTSALLVVTRTLLVTSALLVVTRTLLVTSALLVVTRTLLVMHIYICTSYFSWLRETLYPIRKAIFHILHSIRCPFCFLFELHRPDSDSAPGGEAGELGVAAAEDLLGRPGPLRFASRGGAEKGQEPRL